MPAFRPRLLSRPAFVLLGVAGLFIGGIGNAAAAANCDPYSNLQWGLTTIDAPSAWTASTGAGVKIGIVDSGVNSNQEDLAGKVVAAATCVGTGGLDTRCTTGGTAGNDIEGHGTHVAGIAAATTGNDKGVAGVAPDAQLVVARVFQPGPAAGDEPTADLNDVKAGIAWVVAHGAQVVNLSIGADQQGFNLCTLTSSCTNPLGAAVESAWNQGALPVIAAGNSDVYSAGGYGNIDALVVGATGKDDTLASYSTAIGNAKWGLVAPGGDPANNGDIERMILSTYAGATCDPPSGPQCYAYLAGTSMAAPQVSGVAALLFAKGLSRQDVVNTILSTTDPIAGCTKAKCGSGRLNAARAVGAPAVSTPPPSCDSGSSTTGPPPVKPTKTTLKPTATTAVHTTPTTALAFTSGTLPPTTTTSTTTLLPRNAIVLRSTSAKPGVPLKIGLAGIVCLAGAALVLSYSLRRTLTTLP